MVGLLDDPVFEPKVVGRRVRDTDVEYRIMEQISRDIDDQIFGPGYRPPVGAAIEEATGTVRIVVDSPVGEVCTSCQSVLNQFKERYPNVDIEVRDMHEGIVYNGSDS